MTDWRTLLAAGDYRGLKRLLLQGRPDFLRRSWGRFEPMEKAILFKLMEPRAAMEFYRGLSFQEKYFLFCAFDPGAIAPILEGLSPRMRSLFRALPPESYEEMFRQLTMPSASGPGRSLARGPKASSRP